MTAHKGEFMEGSECTCVSRAEHEALVRAVDESFKRDDERARMRTQRSATYLRLEAERINAELTNGNRY
jgi:hypothetical protein